jgi:hypothetical protein
MDFLWSVPLLSTGIQPESIDSSVSTVCTINLLTAQPLNYSVSHHNRVVYVIEYTLSRAKYR